MNNNIEKYKADLDRLIKLGRKMNLDLIYQDKEETSELTPKEAENAKKYEDKFHSEYQNFYTEAHSVIRQLLPVRLDEFEKLYKGESRRKEIDHVSFNIQDWLNGIRSGANSRTGIKTFNDLAITSMRFATQLAILRSVSSRFESSLFDIKQLVQADLFDSELESSETLAKSGFLRGAGAVAGVVLEKHLAQVATNHSIKTRKKNPSINDFNELLKSNSVLDVPSWRQIQRLGDIRNLCDHNKDREPKEEEVLELIAGVEKFTKTLF